MVFEHPLPSAYSSTRFAEYMSSMKNIRCAVMGFSLDETILSTAIEGFHRGHRYQITTRYCDLCSPFYRMGGIKGLARWIVVAGTVAAGVLFYLHP